MTTSKRQPPLITQPAKPVGPGPMPAFRFFGMILFASLIIVLVGLSAFAIHSAWIR